MAHIYNSEMPKAEHSRFEPVSLAHEDKMAHLAAFIEKNIAMFFLYTPFLIVALFCKLIIWAQACVRQRQNGRH